VKEEAEETIATDNDSGTEHVIQQLLLVVFDRQIRICD
jgi:hypothetical protein